MSKKRKLDSNNWNEMHEELDGQKRDVTVGCPASYSLCPSALGGDCCPTSLSCGISSCYATTSTTTSGCPAGFMTCGVVDGGGCCPSGYSCERNTCIAPTGTLGAACGPGSFLCPSSFSFGCCKNGLSCGQTSCYETTSTTRVTLTLTLTTTNSHSAPTTITTVIETVYNPATPTPALPSPLPTPIAKLPATTTTSSTSETSVVSTPSSGINAKELGGIIGACIFLLLAVLIATYFILRRLNLTIKLTSIVPSTTRPGRSNSRSTNNFGAPSIGIDSLQQIPSSETGSFHSRSYNPRTHRTTPSELSNNTPLNAPGVRTSNVRGSRILPLGSFSPLNWPSRIIPRSGNTSSSPITGAYRSIPSSDSSRHWRNGSDGSQSVSNPTTTATMNAHAAELDSSGPQGYFDIPIPKTASTTGPRHGRQWSDASELSNGTDNTNESYELEAPSPRSSQADKVGRYDGYGASAYGEKKSLREGIKNKVQDWVGMTSVTRKTSKRKDENFGFSAINGGLGGFKPIPSPTQASPSSIQDQDQLLRDVDISVLPSFSRFGEKSRLEAIREALRESGTTVNTNTNFKLDDGGEVSNSRAQIARMELRRAETDLTLMNMEGTLMERLMDEGDEFRDLDIS